MSEKPYLIDLITCLAEKEVEFIICGGMAAVFHGVERMTMDLDISLNMAPKNIKKFLPVVKDIGLIPRVPVPPESLLDEKQINLFVREKHALVFTFVDPDRPYRQIDVFLTGDKSYHLLKKHTVNAKVGNKKIKIISAEKLLEMKMAVDPPRDKDKLDIAALKKIIENKKARGMKKS
jgi:hypothetical protein